ncbi:hypothetical protein Psch_02768 [Pelotomaculum schinkii]|uniref:Uncharacterized protein n=1 Tax=Pelotomaculum schinkii TaxID=78350 RepID=A0A4Y7RBI7_9FIRM|nr:hypothetical protein [Pelotomaculum schinkii]TEB05727.1 hypothetical protein Psch_02768 [Pelotomaculum schinkii]
MLEQLKASQGKKIVLELVNGRIIGGTIVAVDETLLRMETEEGVGIIPVSAVQIIWDTLKRSLTGEDMEQLAQQLKDKLQVQIACSGFQFNCRQSYICRPPDFCTSAFGCPGGYAPSQGGSQCPITFGCGSAQFYGFAGPQGSGQTYAGEAPKAEIACTGFPGFSCARSYICRPPDTCTFSFACPGSYVPSFPSGGGACPIFFCGPFQFGQPCGPFQFGQPCGPFQFGLPCGPFQFGQPCSPFVFGQPCSPFVFGGSQCGVPGGFVCPGQQFIGVAPMTGTKSQEPPLPPADFAVHKQNKDHKE